MKISITGTPCTGKTTLSKNLSKKLKYKRIDLNKFAKENGLFEEYDEKRESWVVDIDKLRKQFKINYNNAIIDSHLSHFICVDIVIVLRLEPKYLRKRLEKRYKNKFKIEQNIESEIFSICVHDALEVNSNVQEINCTNKSKKEILNDALEIIKSCSHFHC